MERKNRFKLNDDKIDIAIWCPAVRHEYWMKQYENLKENNDCSFRIFYCGQNKPSDDDLDKFPEEIVYIHCDMPGINPHAEIARRFSVNSNTKYVMDWNDDFYAYPHLLDNLILEIESHDDKEMVVGPAFRPVMEGQPGKVQRFINEGIDTYDGCLGLVTHLTKVETARKVGGFDKRFIGYWCIYDYYFRLGELDVGWKVTSEAKISEDDTQQFKPKNSNMCKKYEVNGRASSKYQNHDLAVLKNLWGVNLSPRTPTPPGGWPSRANRTGETILFEDDELIFTIYHKSKVSSL